MGNSQRWGRSRRQYSRSCSSSRGERDVAVLVALALLDAQTHPDGVNVGELPSTELARPKPCGIGRHQQGAMLGVGGDGEQAHQLVVVEDLGQSGRCLGAGHIEVRVGHTERNAVQEAHAVAHAVAALPAQSPLLVKVDEVVLDLLGRDLVGTAAVVTREPGDGGEIGTLRVLGEAANGHVVGHALTQRCHGSSPWRCERVRRHTGGHARRCSWHRIPGNVGRRESREGGAMNSKLGKTPTHRLTGSWRRTPY